MKKLSAKFVGPTLILYPVLWLSCLPGCQDPGVNFSNYADFNRVEAALKAIDGVTIEEVWFHQDGGQEEFGFEVRLHQSEPINLTFPDGNPLRGLQKAELVEILRYLLKSKAVWII